MTCRYIIYSSNLNRIYVGITQSGVEERLNKHNGGFYGTDSYTSHATNWEIYLFIEVENYVHSIRIERHLKRMRSKKYIQDLKKYPELRLKLYQSTEKA